MSIEIKSNIQKAIMAFSNGNMFENGVNLFNKLGYNTERTSRLFKPDYEGFRNEFLKKDSNFNRDKAKVIDWLSVHFLFQLTKEEVLKQTSLFDTKKVDNQAIESYLFFAIELKGGTYSRTQLANITREVNKVFAMPVMILFKYGEFITLSVINRRINKKDESKDVLLKVTLIKDISIKNPHRAHIEILFDLSFDELKDKYQFTNFIELHNAWQTTLDIKELNKRFFKELANWYFWAAKRCVFPDDELKDKNVRNATNVIRLITRLIFVWFLKEKKLVPDELFDQKILNNILKYNDQNKSTYYKAILQNLFFATLNTEMGKRKFRSKTDNSQNSHYFIHNLFRYRAEFYEPEVILKKYFEPIPFLNGGLFECLDKEVEINGKLKRIRIDGFSDRKDNTIKVPDELFFMDKEKEIDLNDVYGTKNKIYYVRGLFDILNSYKFTVAENTPIEEEVALDPELLGRVFENLLANYNPETQTTARKQTGSFYTPREIVNYMVDESLIDFLTQKMDNLEIYGPRIRDLISYSENPNQFTLTEREKIIDAIDTIKILDPACGSGAFPMGILHKLVHILHKIDPGNELWKQRQIQKAEKIDDAPGREAAIQTIEEAFENNELDYGRKLYLIENCIYGVDIQPIAVQIAKLRFFISLIVDQNINKNKNNIGIRPLPNLETKFVAANALIGLKSETANLFTSEQILIKKEKLKSIRHSYFEARTPKRKQKCREADKKLRDELTDLLIDSHNIQPENAKLLAAWDPYDQNISAPFFDPEWMFSINDGFDILMGNPPYIFTRDADFTKEFKQYIAEEYFSKLFTKSIRSKATQSAKINLFALFILRGIFELKPNGILTFILPNNILRTTTYDLVRKYLLDNTKIIEIADLGSGVFENVTASTILLRLIRGISENTKVKIITDINDLDNHDFKQTEIVQSQFTKNVSYTFNLFVNSRINDLIQKISEDKTSLGNYCQEIIEGIVAHKVLIKDHHVKNSFPLIEGKTIKRYGLNEIRKYIIWDVNEIHRTRPDYLWAARKKIILQRISGGKYPLRATIDTNGYKTFASVNNIILKEKYSELYEPILSLINSKILNWYYATNFSNKSELTVNISKTFLERLPIINFDNYTKALLTKFVNFILIGNNLKRIDISQFFEKIIDAMIYELYLQEIIKNANCGIIKHLFNIPEIDIDEKTNNLKILDNLLIELSSPHHPVSVAMFKMDTIEEIRIIEGKQ